jgi:hypothetical protein
MTLGTKTFIGAVGFVGVKIKTRVLFGGTLAKPPRAPMGPWPIGSLIG